MLSYLLVLQFAQAGIVWVFAQAAFFLMGGYFIIRVVFFRPWGLQNTKNAFYKKMLCDQASDTINSKSLPTASHSPLVFFYIILRGLSTARVEINPAHCSQQL